MDSEMIVRISYAFLHTNSDFSFFSSKCYKTGLQTSLASKAHPDKAKMKMNKKVHERISSHRKQWDNQQTAPDSQT